MTPDDYAYWCGRLSQALRALVDEPDSVTRRLSARGTLNTYEVAKRHADGPFDQEKPYPDGPLASRAVESEDIEGLAGRRVH